VQNYLTQELHSAPEEKNGKGVYGGLGVRRRNVEVAVRTVTNLTKINDPGHSDHLHGDVVPRSVVEEFNRNLPKGKDPIKHSPILKGIEHVPDLASQNWMARLNYQRLSSTLQQAAAEGWKAELHGNHPIPGLALGSEFGKAPKGYKPGSY